MSRWLKLIEAADGLNLDSPEAQIVYQALDTVLLLEGPPPIFLPDISEDFHEGFVRTKVSHAIRSHASTWLTGPWRCLLLETHTIAMGRPITLPKKAGEEEKHRRSQTITDSRSDRFMTHIEQACRALEIAEPIGEGAVHCFSGSKWSFVSWRAREDDESYDRTLRGDVDNYAKCYLDALQRARVLTNDRGVVRLTVTKEVPDSWLEPPKPLPQRISEAAQELKSKGLSHAEIKADLVLTHAQMAELFEDYQAPSRHRHGRRKAQPATVDEGAIAEALAGLRRKRKPLTYSEAFQSLPGSTDGPTRTAFRSAVAQDIATHLESDIFDPSAPIPFGMDRRTLKRLLKDHPKALEALTQSLVVHTATHTGGRQASSSLDKAVQRIHAGDEFALVVAQEQVNANSLQSRLRRAAKSTQMQEKP